MVDELANTFEEIADHLVVDGSSNKAIAYEQAADMLRSRESIPSNPAEIDGVGESLREDIFEWQQYGEISKLVELRDEYPYIHQLRQIDNIAAKRAKQLHEELDITYVGDIIEQSNSLREITGIGAVTKREILESAYEYIEERTQDTDIVGLHKTYKRLEASLYTEFDEELEKVKGEKLLPFAFVPVGEYRRDDAPTNTLDILVSGDVEFDRVRAALVDEQPLREASNEFWTITSETLVRVTYVSEENFGVGLLFETGSTAHVLNLKTIAKEQGYTLNRCGLFDGDECLVSNSEKAIYEELGIAYVEPSERHGRTLSP